MDGKFSVVLNAHARSGEELAKTVRDRWGAQATDFCVADDVATFERAIARAKEQKVQTLIVGGGDGTIRQAVKHLLGTDIRMGILPLGTGNALAHELGIPISTPNALEFFDSIAVPVKIDVGKFNDSVFVNVATIGITSKIVREIANSPKGRFGRLVYVPALFRAVRFVRSFAAQIETPSEKFVEKAVQIVVASSRQHGGPFQVTESASINDGLLSVYVVRKGDRKMLFRYGLGLLFGKHTKLPSVWSANVQTIEVKLSKPDTFVLDGDPERVRMASCGLMPAAIEVLASPDSAAVKGIDESGAEKKKDGDGRTPSVSVSV